MAKIINGNNDGNNGSNKTVTIPGRGSNIPVRKIVKEIKDGKHPNHSTYTRNDKEYPRAKPDNKKKNNVNK